MSNELGGSLAPYLSGREPELIPHMTFNIAKYWAADLDVDSEFQWGSSTIVSNGASYEVHPGKINFGVNFYSYGKNFDQGTSEAWEVEKFYSAYFDSGLAASPPWNFRCIKRSQR